MPVPIPDPFEGFHPDASFAVMAQQEEINRLRREIAEMADRLVWQRAVNLQMQGEFNNEISLLRGQIDLLVQGTQDMPSAGPDGPLVTDCAPLPEQA